jgi:hypothetical protein
MNALITQKVMDGFLVVEKVLSEAEEAESLVSLGETEAIAAPAAPSLRNLRLLIPSSRGCASGSSPNMFRPSLSIAMYLPLIAEFDL